MFPVIIQIFCVFSLFAQENATFTGRKVADMLPISTDSIKNILEVKIGGPDCLGCKGLLPTGPLFLVDGWEVSSDVLAQLTPDNIKNISVITDAASALEMYGIRGINGVVVITSKLSKKDLKKMIKKWRNNQKQ